MAAALPAASALSIRSAHRRRPPPPAKCSRSPNRRHRLQLSKIPAIPTNVHVPRCCRRPPCLRSRQPLPLHQRLCLCRQLHRVVGVPRSCARWNNRKWVSHSRCTHIHTYTHSSQFKVQARARHRLIDLHQTRILNRLNRKLTDSNKHV